MRVKLRVRVRVRVVRGLALALALARTRICVQWGGCQPAVGGRELEDSI